MSLSNGDDHILGGNGLWIDIAGKEGGLETQDMWAPHRRVSETFQGSLEHRHGEQEKRRIQLNPEHKRTVGQQLPVPW